MPDDQNKLAEAAKHSTQTRPADSDAAGETTSVLVELAPQTGQVRQVALTTPEDIAARSAEALDNAMDAIRHMARRVVDTVTPLQIAPSSVEIEFGLKLTAEGNAIITKATIEGNLKVKMTWDLKK